MGTGQEYLLFQVDVELDRATNREIREMFVDENAGRKMVVFFSANKITISSTLGALSVTRVSLRGSPGGLEKFVATYFTPDEGGVVYSLLYR